MFAAILFLTIVGSRRFHKRDAYVLRLNFDRRTKRPDEIKVPVLLRFAPKLNGRDYFARVCAICPYLLWRYHRRRGKNYMGQIEEERRPPLGLDVTFGVGANRARWVT